MTHRLADVLENYYGAREQGHDVDLESLCRGDAGLLERAREMISREHDYFVANRTASLENKRLTALPSTDTGTSIGEFRILERIGSGGMGVVYRAYQPSLDREVAIKLIRTDRTIDPNASLRLRREAMVMASLDHPNLTPVYAIGQEDDQLYIVMRLLRGSNLEAASIPMAPAEAARIGIALASALQAVHEVGVLHRDLKPANVILENGAPWIVDFGLAKLERASTRLTQSQSAPGTLAYMAPESLHGEAQVFDPRIDVYGLGATLYELIAGRPPFDAANTAQMIRQLLYDDPPPLRLPGRDRDLETIVLHALEKNPSSRFATARELQSDLERYISGEPISTNPVGPLKRIVRKAGRRKGLTTTLLVATGIIVVLGLQLVRTTVERHRRDAAEITKIAAALSTPSIDRARSDMKLISERIDTPELSELARALDEEAVLRFATLAIQQRQVKFSPWILDRHCNRLSRSLAPRTRLLLVAAEALHSHRDWLTPSPDWTTPFPRTAAISDAIRRGTDLPTALAKAPPRSCSTDALFSAFLVRLTTARPELALREFDGVTLDGPDAHAIRYAKALTLETIEDYRAAYLEIGQLLSERDSATITASTYARLASLLRAPEASDLARAIPDPPLDDNRDCSLAIRNAALLQIYRDTNNDTEFWPLWKASRELLRNTPAYWLFASDMAGSVKDYARARSIITEGLLETNAFPEHQLDMQSILLQVEWLALPCAEDTEPFESDPELEQTVSEIARRARELAVRAEAAHKRLVVNECFLTEARCARALGNRELGWEKLEKACADGSLLEALTTSIGLVSYRVLVRYLTDEPDPDEEATGPLVAASATAFERARTIDRLAKTGNPFALAAANQNSLALMTSAFHLARVDEALPRAISIAAETRDDPGAEPTPYEAFAAIVIDNGGIPLEDLLQRSTTSIGFVHTAIKRALIAIEKTSLDEPKKRDIATRWHALLSADDRCSSTVFRDLLTILEARAKKSDH
ncbi:MAG: serine/threonine protein kinase [Planctomycetes bacterium]|nr:serine/threonine protein kinase [Planctomycetota bacterium]